MDIFCGGGGNNNRGANDLVPFRENRQNQSWFIVDDEEEKKEDTEEEEEEEDAEEVQYCHPGLCRLCRSDPVGESIFVGDLYCNLCIPVGIWDHNVGSHCGALKEATGP